MFIRRLVIIIIAITALAAGFQVMRSMGMINLIRNVNSDFKLDNPVMSPPPPGLQHEKYLIVTSEDEANSQQTTKQVMKTLDYMKKEYRVINTGAEIPDLEDFNAVFFVFERLDYLADPGVYIDYVKNHQFKSSRGKKRNGKNY